MDPREDHTVEEALYAINKGGNWLAYDAWVPRVLADEVVRLRSLVVEHHRVGAMEGVGWGDRCPVCMSHAPDA